MDRDWRQLPLTPLRTFECVARHASFTRAADELCLTQSAVSQQIRHLESLLGQSLFERQGRRLRLTDAGHRYFAAVSDAIGALQRATEAIFSEPGRGLLRLQVNTALMMRWLAPRLARFQAQEPGVTVQVSHANWDSDYTPGSVDLMLAHGSGGQSGLSETPLLRAPLQPFARPDIAARIDRVEQVREHRLIDVMGNRDQWPHWCRRYGLEDSGLERHWVDTVSFALALCEEGQGICLCQPGLVSDQRLVPIGDWPLDTEDHYYIAHREDRPLSPVADAFKQWLLACD